MNSFDSSHQQSRLEQKKVNMSHRIKFSSWIVDFHITTPMMTPTSMSIYEAESNFDGWNQQRRRIRRTNTSTFCSCCALVLLLWQTKFHVSLAFGSSSVPYSSKGRPNRDQASLLLHKSKHNNSKRYSYRLSNDPSFLTDDPGKQNTNVNGKMIDSTHPAETWTHETVHKNQTRRLPPSSIISSATASSIQTNIVPEDNFKGMKESTGLTSAINIKKRRQSEKQQQNPPTKNFPVITHQSPKPRPPIYKSIIVEPDNSPINPKKLLLDVEISTSKILQQKRQHQQDKKSKQLLLQKLSRAHRSMLANTSTSARQRFVTGKYPLYVTVQQNPTRKWLGLAESQIYLNGTQIDKSLASYDIFHWLDDKEERKELHGEYEFLSLELVAEIHVRRPGYVNILPRKGAGISLLEGSVGGTDSSRLSVGGQRRKGEKGEGLIGGFKEGMFCWKNWKLKNDDLASLVGKDGLFGDDDESLLDGGRLWVTGFSLTKQRGELHTLDINTGIMSQVNDKTAKSIKWPNEVASIPRQLTHRECNENAGGLGKIPNSVENGLEDALLVMDGFLVPGKDKGGLYVVKNPGNTAAEERVCLTDRSDWFYHRCVFQITPLNHNFQLLSKCLNSMDKTSFLAPLFSNNSTEPFGWI